MRLTGVAQGKEEEDQVTGNPKGSPWRSTPRDKRHRKPITLTLSDEARERLDELAPDGTRSAFVEDLIMNAEPSKKVEG